jgi:hydrogenase maturation protease
VKLLILGYGNPLRGDDGFGWRAAERLAGLGRDADIEVRALQQLTPELAADVARAEQVIFIDARRGLPAGRLMEETLAPAAEASFTHRLEPAGLLAAARDLYGRAPRAVVYWVAGESFEYGERLSPGVGAALDLLCRKLAGDCRCVGCDTTDPHGSESL